VFSGVFTDEEADGVRGKGSGDTTTFDFQTLLETLPNIPLSTTCCKDYAPYLVKAILLLLGLRSSSARLSVLPNYQTLE
jgi:hypothetical protein